CNFLCCPFLALCGRMWMLYISMCLAGWTLSSEAARLRCGSDLLSDLQFVCGERGIYLGKGSWSGYGPRPRGKGIVDKCCRSGGCDLQHLEMYCAEPKFPEAMTVSSTTSRPHTPTPGDMFEAVFQKRLLEHLGPPDSPQREEYRKKKSAQPKRKNKSSTAYKRTRRKPTKQPRSALQSPF
uniref:Insulin-like domain-containing protein n=1 Tax=Gouania willdenowi TaxID=441366 RepID=A0A8C5E4R1_GOUWI